MRSRSEKDRRRVLFRSFAKPKQDLRVGEKDKNDSRTLSACDYDNTVDLMDVVSHTQPENTMLTKVPEEFFRPIVDKSPLSTYSLWDLEIPRHEFQLLLQLLLLFAPDQSYDTACRSTVRSQEVSDVAYCLLSAFGLDGVAGIGWQDFELTIANTMVSFLSLT